MTPDSTSSTEQPDTTTRVSLREQLGAALPDFTLVVPDGWKRVPVDEAGEALVQGLVSEKMMQTGRPDLMAYLRRMLREGFEEMRQSGATAVFMPIDPSGQGYLGVPTSIIAVIRKSEPGASLDEYVTHAIRRYDAKPLFDDMRTVRFETEKSHEVDGGTIVVSSTHYVTPMPGSRRQRALELIATYSKPEGTPRTDEKLEMLHALFDVCASTVRWVAPA